MVAKIKANPHYVSSLLGPLALAAANDKNGELFSFIDYLNRGQRRLVIESLIRPNFERLANSTKADLARALAYFSFGPNAVGKVIEEKLLLCEVPPECHRLFLADLWDSLFPGESGTTMAGGVEGVANRPLVAGEFAFAKKARSSLDELVDELRVRLLG